MQSLFNVFEAGLLLTEKAGRYLQEKVFLLKTAANKLAVANRHKYLGSGSMGLEKHICLARIALFLEGVRMAELWRLGLDRRRLS